MRIAREHGFRFRNAHLIEHFLRFAQGLIMLQPLV